MLFVHAVGDREHVMVVDRYRAGEGEALAVVPGRASPGGRATARCRSASFHGEVSPGNASFGSALVQPNCAK